MRKHDIEGKMYSYTITKSEQKVMQKSNITSNIKLHIILETIIYIYRKNLHSFINIGVVDYN